MELGLCAGFGEPVAHELDFIASLGVDRVRQQVSIEMDDSRLRDVLREFVDAPVRLLLILHAGHMDTTDGHGGTRRVEPHEYAALGRRVVTLAAELGLTGYQLEVGNEPDLAHKDYKTDPLGFAEAVRQTLESVRAEGFEGTVVSGGISNLLVTKPSRWDRLRGRVPVKRGLTYLEAVVASGRLPDGVTVGVHRYPVKDDPREPQDGFRAREEEVSYLRRLIGQRLFAVTECGAHDFRQSEEEQAAALAYELDFWTKHGAQLAVLYQLNDAPGRASYEACWGLQAPDGRPKQAVAMLQERAETRRG